eukprot:gene22807-biopygen5780
MKKLFIHTPCTILFLPVSSSSRVHSQVGAGPLSLDFPASPARRGACRARPARALSWRQRRCHARRSLACAWLDGGIGGRGGGVYPGVRSATISAHTAAAAPPPAVAAAAAAPPPFFFSLWPAPAAPAWWVGGGGGRPAGLPACLPAGRLAGQQGAGGHPPRQQFHVLRGGCPPAPSRHGIAGGPGGAEGPVLFEGRPDGCVRTGATGRTGRTGPTNPVARTAQGSPPPLSGQS